MTTLGQIFIKNKYPKIEFKFPNKKFRCNISLLEITKKGGKEGVFFKDGSEGNIIEDEDVTELIYPQILNVELNIKSLENNQEYINLDESTIKEKIVEKFYIDILEANHYSENSIYLTKKLIEMLKTDILNDNQNEPKISKRNEVKIEKKSEVKIEQKIESKDERKNTRKQYRKN